MSEDPERSIIVSLNPSITLMSKTYKKRTFYTTPKKQPTVYLSSPIWFLFFKKGSFTSEHITNMRFEVLGYHQEGVTFPLYNIEIILLICKSI